MKVVEFSEEQLSDLNKIGEILFFDEKDPRSPNYKRELKRPKIKWSNIIIFIGFSLVLFIIFLAALDKFDVSYKSRIFLMMISLLLYIISIFKKTVIVAIKIYQRYAPSSVRNKCRFEPSCSEYMLISIEKYGIIKGLKKGLRRLKRCNVNHGGYDFP